MRNFRIQADFEVSVFGRRPGRHDLSRRSSASLPPTRTSTGCASARSPTRCGTGAGCPRRHTRVEPLEVVLGAVDLHDRRAFEDHHAFRAVVRVQRDARAALEVRGAVEEHLRADRPGHQRTVLPPPPRLCAGRPAGRRMAGVNDVEPGPRHTVLVLVNSRIPSAPSSRPYPDFLMPPNGRRGPKRPFR